MISKRSNEGPPAEAVFEVTFHDVEEALHFIVERSGPGAVVEVVFLASPEQWGFVAEGNLNPVEFQVLRHDVGG